ncbi:toll/interleukin-1 receptor domain-containing protein [Pelagimonas phthalicica]|uniref:toll/interleukin-1 receptor domain-containing protein n=1 Tax=Pelagimonas phthalicica TaxID=1037362 RepID=UPI00159BE7F3|nr:toll/interleukin-1 receptor domain-containing protein [Pelagimonas phthalicica]
MTKPFQVFFSYATDDWNSAVDSEDLQFVFNHLEGETNRSLIGKSCALWQDRNRLKWGEAWRKELHKTGETSAFFIPLVSHAWLSSDYCLWEFEIFRNATKSCEGPGRILPLLLKPMSDADVAAMSDEQKTAYEALRAIQMQVWPDLKSLLDSGPKPLLAKLSRELKDRIMILDATPTTLRETNESNPTAPQPAPVSAISVETVPPISGAIDYGRDQDNGVLMELATTGYAKARFDGGEVLFHLSGFFLKVEATGGTPTNPNANFLHGWSGPLAQVHQVGALHCYTLMVEANKTPMAGAPLADPDMGPVTRLFDLEPHEGEEVSISVKAVLEWECVQIATPEVDLPKPVQDMQRKVVDLLMRKQREDTPLKGWSDAK